VPFAQQAIQATANRFAESVAPLIQKMRDEGMSYASIAAELDARSIQTARGGSWHPATVRNVLYRAKKI
jgi:hypothetical protein